MRKPAHRLETESRSYAPPKTLVLETSLNHRLFLITVRRPPTTTTVTPYAEMGYATMAFNKEFVGSGSEFRKLFQV